MTLQSARSISLFVAVLGLGACSAGGTSSSMRTNSLIPPQSNADSSGRGTSWVTADANALDLLYVSNHKDGSVYVYSYPQGKLKGWLLNLKASGLCSDLDGNVFIPQGNEIVEYSHGGARPLRILRSPLGGDPQFCAVDPATRDLAVSGGGSRGAGVAIYSSGKGSPASYATPDRELRYWSLTYDDKGNLFVEGGSKDGSAHLLELPKGDTQIKEVAWSGAHRPLVGSIQWDGKYLAAESPRTSTSPATIYRYAVNGRQAAFVGKTALTGAGSHLQSWIGGGQAVVPSQGSLEANGVTLYDYPGGGRSRQIIQDAREPQAATVSSARRQKIAVTTYHYNNLRTGWDSKETILTADTVNYDSFGLLHTAALDDQVDTQPLLVPNETTTRGVAPGKHDVVYVTTENDSVYAIDASSGTTLFQQSLGNPVPTPLGCNNNGPNVGIDGTPVIDKKANVMYVIAYVMQGSQPEYYIHELSLSNLSDVISPVLVTASHQLTNGSTFTFNATYQRQRPAMLESKGVIYAGFGSFCDFAASTSRGWLLGWQAGSLTPLAANRLNDTLYSSPYSFYLSSIWMSGYGMAADEAGQIYFVTGNSDPSGDSYNSATNISETVAKVSANLTQMLSFFTPSDVGGLDQSDADFGSGGVMLLPKKAAKKQLAVAAGKVGTMFLLNQKSLGGYTPSGPDHVLDEENIGGCWCGESYFDASSDSIPRVVGSGGNNVTVWQVRESPAKLVLSAYSAGLPGAQDPGFFTSVSSDGNHPGGIIWALARPQNVPGNITLFALSAEPTSSGSQLATLYQGAAGSWESGGGNANLVPVVANGKVYVASYEQLDIFGLLGSNGKRATASILKAPRAGGIAPHELSGTLVAVSGTRLSLRTRNGSTVSVDGSEAIRLERSAVLVAGESFNARGTYGRGGILHATSIVRVKPWPSTWPADR